MTNFDYLNYLTRLENGCIDNRSSSSNDGSRFERISQSEIDRHNAEVHRTNNGMYPDWYTRGSR